MMDCIEFHENGTVWGKLSGAVAQINQDMFYGLDVMRSAIAAARSIYLELPLGISTDDAIEQAETILRRADAVARG